MFSYVHSRQMCLLKARVSPLMQVFKHILWAWCRKLLKTLLVILGSIHEFGLMCMFVIAYFRCTLNSYFLLVVLSVMLMSRKFNKFLWPSNSTLYFTAGSCLFSICKSLSARDLSWKLACLCNSRLPLLSYLLFSANNILTAQVKVW